MTHPIYSEQQLLNQSLAQLKTIYTQLGCTHAIEDKRRKSAWVVAIVRFQEEQAVKVDLGLEDKTCAGCPNYQPRNDGIDKGWCNLFNHFAKSCHPMTGDCLNSMEAEKELASPVLKASLGHETEPEPASPVTETSPSSSDSICHSQPNSLTINRQERAKTIEILEIHGDEYVVRNQENSNVYVVRPNAFNPRERCECGDTHFRGIKCKHQIAVEEYQQRLTVAIKEQAISGEQQQIESFMEDMEIDQSHNQDSYRVWHGMNLIGAIYYKDSCNEWVARPHTDSDSYYCQTEEDAKYCLATHVLTTTY